MKATFQIIHQETGQRSKPFICEMQELAELLVKMDEGPSEKDYVLVIAREGDKEFSTAPLVTVSTFLQMHNIQWAEESGEVANG